MTTQPTIVLSYTGSLWSEVGPSDGLRKHLAGSCVGINGQVKVLGRAALLIVWYLFDFTGWSWHVTDFRIPVYICVVLYGRYVCI